MADNSFAQKVVKHDASRFSKLTRKLGVRTVNDIGDSKTGGVVDIYMDNEGGMRSNYSLKFIGGKDEIVDKAGVGIHYKDIAYAEGNVVI